MAGPSVEQETPIFKRDGLERTVYTVDVPLLLWGAYLKEPERKDDTLTVWIVGDKDKPLNADLGKSLDDINPVRVSADELHQKLVDYGVVELGMKPLLARKEIHGYKMNAERAVKIDIAATQAEILSDIKTLSKKGLLPTAYTLKFNNFKVIEKSKMLIAAKSRTFGPVVGIRAVVQNLRSQKTYVEVQNETREKYKIKSRGSDRLTLVFV